MAAKIAFLVPIYPPHFEYARSLLRSFYEYELHLQAELWFVFTDENESALFGDYAHKIVLPSELRIFESKGIINIKKFFGIKNIQKFYDYIIVLDAESLFIKSVNLYELCEEYFRNRVLLGNFFSVRKTCNTVIEKSKVFFSLPKFSKHAKKLQRSQHLYLWFNQPCIYKTATLYDFWCKIDYDKIIKNLGFWAFDYYIYMYYLLLYEDFTIKSMQITARYGACEAADALEFGGDDWKNYTILLSSPTQLEHFDNAKCFLLIQLDNTKGW